MTPVSVPGGGPVRSVTLANGRAVDSWWVSEVSDLAERMSDEVGCPAADAYRCIAQIATDRQAEAEGSER